MAQAGRGASRRSAATGLLGMAAMILSLVIPMRFPDTPERVLDVGIGAGLILLAVGCVLYFVDRGDIAVDPVGSPVAVADQGSVAVAGGNYGIIDNSRTTIHAPQPRPPVFTVIPNGASHRQEAYAQNWKVAFVEGERPEAFGWRFRTPYQPPPEWKAVEIAHLPRAHFSPVPQDVSGPLLDDPELGPDQVAFELRYFWRGEWHHEMHVYEVTRRQTTNTSPIRTHVELGKKLLPVKKWADA